ncbi:MAG: class I SAM-dependent methyltransferase [Methanotrichaceae archaeon]|nr:class I SAM-dependent methyltransferase [Methanotrichaceae archaeon]
MQNISNKEKSKLSCFPISKNDRSMWDWEWLKYFMKASSDVYLVKYTDFPIPDIRNKTRAEVWKALRIWSDGSNLIGRRVLEIGCGTGYLGKQLGQIAEFYLGIDHSALAIYIAQQVSPSNCVYALMEDENKLSFYESSMDILVGREFFIHQNWDNALVVLKSAHYLLKDTGTTCLDFYLSNPKVPQGLLHSAKNPLDPAHPSCAFIFSYEEVYELAKICCFQVVDITDDLESQRRLVTLKSQKSQNCITEIKTRSSRSQWRATPWTMLFLLIILLVLRRRITGLKRLINLISTK